MDAIVTQQLAPSQKVSENILTGLFDISRTMARNAMERLTAQQFLLSVSPRVTRVAPLTLLDVKQNFAVRKMLQPNIMAIAASLIDHDEISHLNDSIPHDQPIKNEKQVLELLKANKRFNVYVSEKLNYPLLMNWVTQLENTTMRVYWLYVKMMGRLPYTWEHQRDLVNAIKSDNEKDVAKYTRMILSTSEERVLKAIISHDQLVTQNLHVPH